MKQNELEKAINILKELKQVKLGSCWIEKGVQAPRMGMYGYSDTFSFALSNEEAREISEKVRFRLECELRSLGVDIEE